MSEQAGFSQFVGLDEHDAPDLLVRMSKNDLHVDGERYGVHSRLIAKAGATQAQLGAAVLRKLLSRQRIDDDTLGAVVLSSRAVDVQELAEAIAELTGCRGYGIERACSGFPAATELAVSLCREMRRPVAVVAAEIISPSINWEPSTGGLDDHERARGQAAKLFGDAAAAVLVVPDGHEREFEILDAWSDEVPDDKQLIQKTAVEESVDPWGNVRPGKTDCMSMPGRRGFLLVRRAPLLLAEALSRSVKNANSLLRDSEHVAHVVPHQANGLILSQLQKLLAETAGNPRVCDCIKDAGNTVSASIPMAMSVVQGSLPAGSLIGMPSVGAGGPGYRPDFLSIGCVLARTASRRND